MLNSLTRHLNPVLQFQGGLSPATSELNLYNRSSSPVGIPMPIVPAPRQRFSTYDTLVRRRTEFNNPIVCSSKHRKHTA